MSEWVWINSLLNGIIANKFVFTHDSLTIQSIKSSYPWGDGLYTPITYENLLNIIQTHDKTTAYRLNTVNPKFATKVHNAFPKNLKVNFSKNIEVKHIDFIHHLSRITNVFESPVIYIHIDFNGLKVIQALPVTYGLKTKWDFKQINLTFDSFSIFLQKILPKLEPLLSEHLQLSELNNLMFNFINLPVIETTDVTFLDLLRSILLELLLQALEHTDIPNLTGGLLLVTGELPALFGHDEYIYLSLLDGLLLKGIWGLWLDTSYVIPNLFYSIQDKLLPKEFSIFNFIPELNIIFADWSSEVPILELNTQPKRKLIGKVAHSIRYKINKTANLFYSKAILNEQEHHYELILPQAVHIDTVIIDNRVHPIVYGPSPLANKTRIMNNLLDLKIHESPKG